MDHREQQMELLLEIKERGLESLSYVLFDELSSQPWAFHLFYKDGKFMINTRDERSYIIGNTVEFNSFEEAKNYFINKLEKFVEHTKKEKKLGVKPPYPSPTLGYAGTVIIANKKRNRDGFGYFKAGN